LSLDRRIPEDLVYVWELGDSEEQNTFRYAVERALYQFLHFLDHVVRKLTTSGVYVTQRVEKSVTPTGYQVTITIDIVGFSPSLVEKNKAYLGIATLKREENQYIGLRRRRKVLHKHTETQG